MAERRGTRRRTELDELEEKIEAAKATLVEQATRYPEFRSHLINDTQHVLRNAQLDDRLRRMLQTKVQMRIVEESPDLVYLVLPHRPPPIRDDADDVATSLIHRAMSDRVFRNELITNGRSTIEREFGIELPESLEVRVVRETRSVRYLVLPTRVDVLAEVLPEATVAGIHIAWCGGTIKCPRGNTIGCVLTEFCLGQTNYTRSEMLPECNTTDPDAPACSGPPIEPI
jgi:Nitrile hydratase, alpha chain